MDNQKNKRNANKMTLTYLIGRQYIEQHKTIGRPTGSNFANKFPQNEEITGRKIGKQSGVGHATVERAAVFSRALDLIISNCENVVSIKRQDFLLGNIKSKIGDINDLDDCKKVTDCINDKCSRYVKDGDKSYRCSLIISRQQAVIRKVLDKGAKDIGDSITKVKDEEKKARLREIEEREAITRELAKKEREEKERLERERIRKEREEKERLEKERIENERLAREKALQERKEQERLAQEKYEKEKSEKERLRKEQQEKDRIEREKKEAEYKEQQRVARDKLEAEKKEAEQKRIREDLREWVK